MAEGKSSFDSEMDALGSAPTNWPPMITEEERSLAEQALNEFKSKNYNSSLTTLGTLSATRSHDHKLMLNKAVAEYYKSGLTKTNEFRQALNEICAKVNSDEVYEIDPSLLHYNQAVILFYAKQYRAAFSVMEKVIPVIVDMCKTTYPASQASSSSANSFFPYKPSSFMCDLHISALQPDRALNFINRVENDVVTFDTKPNSLERDESAKEDATHCRSNGQGQERRDAWKILVGQYRTRSYLMLKMIKPAKSSLKTLLNTTGMTTSIMFLKSQFELVRGNYQKAARVLTSCPELLSSKLAGTPLLVMYYNNMGVVHLNMHKPNMALHYLREAVEQNTTYDGEIKKKHARDSDVTDLSKGNLPGWPLQSLCGSQYYVLTYNMGVTLLHCGQFQQAFDCLLETVQLYTINPRLWLRLAECCVMANRHSNDEDRRLAKKLEVIERAVGSGLHHKLIFGCGVTKDNASSTIESGAMPMATMEFASLCLDNALLCLDSPAKITFDTSGNASSKQDSSEASRTTQSPSVFVQAPPGNPLTAEEVANLRCSVLALKSYVSLHHHDHLVALSFAEELLCQPRLSPAHKYLAHMYKAEALVALDRISDAIQNFNPDNITDVSVTPAAEPTATSAEKIEKNFERGASEPPEDKRASYPWSPKDVMQAKGIMMYNLAATYAIRGDYEKASIHLAKSKTLAGLPLPTQMYYLKIYLELMQGRRKNVQNFIKDNFGHMTVNRLI